MKRILLLSDTHIPERAKKLPDEIWRKIEEYDGVIHCGDFTSESFYQEIKSLAKQLWAVRGNMDDAELFFKLPEKLVIEIEGVKIGIYHGEGAPYFIEKRVLKRFENEKVNLIIFGHSHHACDKVVSGIRMVNPGSPTDTFFSPRLTYGELVLDNGEVKGVVIHEVKP
ncbi:hypothetical protein DRN73_04465 [Candidatus Pacearchaeota archaeon]|nr:MAG: hypothetical protein DRN73_04465 [Candidatus Pacearchaeota archaeon]